MHNNSILQTILTANQRNNAAKPNYKRTFNPNLLPTPIDLYARFGFKLKGNGWSMHKCPFHDDKHASLSINATHGGFICHACHSKGNLIGFYMQMTNTNYQTAMIELGAYNEH